MPLRKALLQKQHTFLLVRRFLDAFAFWDKIIGTMQLPKFVFTHVILKAYF
jgi:hypothetical protein